MNYTGIDYHKRYSVACTLDGQGHLLKQSGIDRNAPEAFAAYFAALDGPSETVIEACWNWATLYDVLEDTQGVAKVVLSNLAKNRIIADAQIKNDRVDARALATLLRGNFVGNPSVLRGFVPSRGPILSMPSRGMNVSREAAKARRKEAEVCLLLDCFSDRSSRRMGSADSGMDADWFLVGRCGNLRPSQNLRMNWIGNWRRRRGED